MKRENSREGERKLLSKRANTVSVKKRERPKLYTGSKKYSFEAPASTTSSRKKEGAVVPLDLENVSTTTTSNEPLSKPQQQRAHKTNRLRKDQRHRRQMSNKTKKTDKTRMGTKAVGETLPVTIESSEGN